MMDRIDACAQPAARLVPNLEGEILRFLWRWKIASSAMLYQRFMPTLRGSGSYSKLKRMRDKGLIQLRSAQNPQSLFWILGRKGFNRIRESLPPMKEEGYLSEHVDHDILVTAIHLGDGVFGPISGLGYVTEQELRRLEPHHLPSGIPNCCGRRPDGYWTVTTGAGSKLVALELELHQKANSDYGSMARFYEDMRQIDQVLWVTKTPAMAKAIHRAVMSETEEESKHSFIPLEAFYRSGWNAPVLIGHDQGKTIYDLLAKTAPKHRKDLCTVFALDARVTPYISPSQRLFAPDGFSY